MVWVVICTIGGIVIVNVPLVYILFRVHNVSGLSELWGYAPNQFLFPLLAFPMAAFATFLAMKLLITNLQHSPSQHPVVKWSTENWIVICLIVVIITSVVCIVDYFRSVKTFDKLKPIYAKKAVATAKEVRTTIEATPKNDREDFRLQLIRSCRLEKKKVVPQLKKSSNFQKELLDLPAGVFLQIVQDPKLQREFHLMNPTVHALNVVQLFTALFTGLCYLFVTLLCIYIFKANTGTVQSVPLRNALSCVFFATVFFAMFPILYAQQRAELEYVVGTGYTINPHIIAGIAMVILLMILVSLEPIKGHFSDIVMARLIPILLVCAGLGSNLIDSQPLRQLVGAESNWGTQVLIVLCFTILWVVIGLHIWPWKSLTQKAVKTINQTTTKSIVQ